MILNQKDISRILWLCIEEGAALKALKTNPERKKYLAPRLGKFLDEKIDFVAILSTAGVIGKIAGPAVEAMDEQLFTASAEELLDKYLMTEWPEG